MDKTSKSHLYRYLGRSSGGMLSVDEMQGLMLQISFAIMMIFMIAYFMFKNRTEKEQEEHIMEIQKQKLVAAVEKVERDFGTRYGLNTLLKIRDDGAAWYDAGAFVENGRLTDNPLLRGAFSDGASHAASDYTDKLALRKEWRGRILSEAEIQENDVSRENWIWLGDRIDAGVSRLEDDVRSVQLLSASLLQRYWMANPSFIKDPAVSELLERFNGADEAGRLLLATELSNELRRYSLNYLGTQANAPMLP